MRNRVVLKGFEGSAAWLRGLALILLGASISSTASAAEAGSPSTYSIRAPVVSATPILTRRTESIPERTCKPVQSRTYSSAYSSPYDSRYDSRYDDRYSSRGGHQYYGYDRGYSYRGGRGDNVGGQILGGIIGGAIGNQFGRGNGRKAFTIAGALLGSSIARDNGRYARNGRDRGGHPRDYEPEYVCQTSTRERVIETVTGYKVTYEYNGALHVRTMSYDPGDFIELRVTAEPLPSTESDAVQARSFSTLSTSSRSPRRTL